MNNDVTKNNKTDITVSTIKSIVGPIPFLGPMLQEMFSVIIPNQRLDRLSKYVAELGKKLSSVEKEQLENKLRNEEFVDLIEESVLQASRALSYERIQYISSVIENSLDKDHISAIENKHLLTILKEINDIEVIWLRFYLVPLLNGDNEFRDKHQNILELIRPTLGSNQEERDKAAIQKSYKEHLTSLGLLERKIDIKVGQSSKLETKGYEITQLGRVLLKQIGFQDEQWLC